MLLQDKDKKKLHSNSSLSPREYHINVFNYFLEDFPKNYKLSGSETIEELKDMISQDANIRKTDIKHFKDLNGKLVQQGVPLKNIYPHDYNLNMEIFFNEGLKITTHNKKVTYLMCTCFDDKQFSPLYNAITSFHESEKGGKIILGVEESGHIKGVSIPDQDSFRQQFIRALTTKSELKNKILLDIDFSFFRVKGQSKLSFNHNEHKKIMIIKVKGKNQQSPAGISQNMSNDDILNPTFWSNNSNNNNNNINQGQFFQPPVYQQPFDKANLLNQLCLPNNLFEQQLSSTLNLRTDNFTTINNNIKNPFFGNNELQTQSNHQDPQSVIDDSYFDSLNLLTTHESSECDSGKEFDDDQSKDQISSCLEQQIDCWEIQEQDRKTKQPPLRIYNPFLCSFYEGMFEALSLLS